MAFDLVYSLVRFSIKHLGDHFIGWGVVPVGSIAADVFKEWVESTRAASEQERARQLRGDFQKLVQNAAAFRKEVEARLAVLAPEKPPAVHQAILTYLVQVPGKVQASMRRKDDPSGRTVPADLPLRKAEDLLLFLPERMPRFKQGDRPVPGTDLVVDHLLGVGGFGEVWKAFHQSRPHAPPVALKFCTHEAAARTLRKEVELLDRVANQGRHRGIVELRYAHLESETPCLEYEYIDGGDLAGLALELHASNKANPEAIAKLLGPLAQSVGFAHRLKPPIVHRDLKPANILTTRIEGRMLLKVADFGIGGLVAEQEVRDWAQTGGGTTVSSGSYTPLYASPQQRRFGRPDPRDDVYALGVIWFQLLLGDLSIEPPRGGSWKKKIRERGASEGMIGLLERCIEDDPEERPGDAQVLADEIRHLLSGTVTIPAAAPTPAPVVEPILDAIPVPPPPQPAQPEPWFYTSQGKRLGPVTLAQLKGLAIAGTLLASDLVWSPKLGEWAEAHSLDGLCPPAPPPVPTALARCRLVLNGQIQNWAMWVGLTLDGRKLGECRLLTGCDIPFEVPPGEHLLEVKFGNTLGGFKDKNYTFRLARAATYRITLKYTPSLLGMIHHFADKLDILEIPAGR